MLIFTGGTYKLSAWLSAYIVTSWPGTLLILIVVPIIVSALFKAGFMTDLYKNARGK